MSKLDHLVANGTFKNRSEALRSMTEEFVERHPDLFLSGEAEKWLKTDVKDSELEDLFSRILAGKRTAAQIVAEGRGR